MLYHIVIEMNIRESCLQTGTFIYKPGISVTKQDFHLQTGIIGLQMGFSGYYLPNKNLIKIVHVEKSVIRVVESTKRPPVDIITVINCTPKGSNLVICQDDF